jgi:diguanylate cyclase (GGDEF)-like protein
MAGAPVPVDQVCQLDSVVFEVQNALAKARTDLTQTRDVECRARHQALAAGLTTLRSGLHFQERLHRLLALLEASPRQMLAVLHLDLNVTAPIADVHGREVGDTVIDIVATRLEREMRPDDMVSRLGGDEFACMLADGVGTEQVGQFADRLCHVVAAPLQVGALELTVHPSIGISIYPDDGATARSLLESADAAMYCAKQNHSSFAFAARPAAR